MALIASLPAAAQDAGAASAEDLAPLYPGTTYSPYADRPFPSGLYWGETHVHTGLSLDAGLFGMSWATKTPTASRAANRSRRQAVYRPSWAVHSTGW